LIDSGKAYDSVSREVFYNIPMKLVRISKVRLNETYTNVRICKNLSDTFPIPNGLNQGHGLSPMLFTLL